MDNKQEKSNCIFCFYLFSQVQKSKFEKNGIFYERQLKVKHFIQKLRLKKNDKSYKKIINF